MPNLVKLRPLILICFLAACSTFWYLASDVLVERFMYGNHDLLKSKTGVVQINRISKGELLLAPASIQQVSNAAVLKVSAAKQAQQILNTDTKNIIPNTRAANSSTLKIKDESKKMVPASSNKSISEPLLPEYYVITMPSIFHGIKWPGYEKFSIKQLNWRDDEILDTLKRNIDHPLVKELHLFYTDDNALEVVKNRKFENEHKIVPVKRDRLIHMADFFLYANKNLLDKTVIAMNGDIILGEGFDKINTTRLRDEKVLYTLTRHGVHWPEKKCQTKNFCIGQPYQESHDTHIFRLATPLNETVLLDKLDYPINMWQAENGMMWTMKFIFGFTVRNPCPILFSHHNHCSKVHGPSAGPAYSIYKLPGKGWSQKHVIDSRAPNENQLNYKDDPK